MWMTHVVKPEPKLCEILLRLLRNKEIHRAKTNGKLYKLIDDVVNTLGLNHVTYKKHP